MESGLPVVLCWDLGSQYDLHLDLTSYEVERTEPVLVIRMTTAAGRTFRAGASPPPALVSQLRQLREEQRVGMQERLAR